MTRIYIVNRNIFSPFTDSCSKEYLKSLGITLTKNPFLADVFVSVSEGVRSYKAIKQLFPNKKFILWTNEPRFNRVTSDFENKDSAVMNVYSGNVFLHNLHFLGSYHLNFKVTLGIDLTSPPKIILTPEKLRARKLCIAVFGYQNPVTAPFCINGEDIDLYVPRQELAYYMYRAGKADIVGKNWPADVKVLESSGFESGNLQNKVEWWDVKMELLQDYKFNICFENTRYPHYCTEKMWHAIAAGCLPIYYGRGTAIYETFPENSFVDAADFDSNESLCYFLENMSPEEHIARYNSCLAVMIQSCAARLEKPDLKTDILDQFIAKVYRLVNK